MPPQLQATGRQQPRGWEQITAALNSAVDQREFLRSMLDVQCKVVAAEYGALWLRDDKGNPALVEVWPEKLNNLPSDSPIAKIMTEAARTGFQRQTSVVLKVEQANVSEEPGMGAHVFVTAIRHQGQTVAVCTAVADCRDPSVISSTTPLRELAAGYYEGFLARHEALTSRLEAQQVRSAMALLAVAQEARGFNGSCLNLVNELVRQLKCTRVSIGWIRGRSIRLVAMSDTEHLKRHSEEVAVTEMAMAECLDQQQPIVYPAPEGAEPLLLHAVVHAHKRLTGQHPNRHALSIPLRDRDNWLGVLTLERVDVPFDVTLIRQLQLIVDVAAPHLSDRKKSDRWLVGHAWQSTQDVASYLVGPKHVAWKLGAIAVITALLLAVFCNWTYRVSAPFVLESQYKRVLPTPYQARLDQVMVEPGNPVTEGQVMAILDSRELRLQLEEAVAQHKMAMVQRDDAMAQHKLSEASQAAAQMEQTAARIALLRYQIEQSRIVAPTDGWVLTGYWKDKVGGIIEQGKPMFEIAPLNDLMAVVRVGESDIDNVKLGQVGQIATRSEPQHKFGISILRIVPMATPVEGANVFEVRSVITDPAPWLRPGMEGLARVEIGKRRIIWIALHRAVDTVRLWLWL